MKRGRQVEDREKVRKKTNNSCGSRTLHCKPWQIRTSGLEGESFCGKGSDGLRLKSSSLKSEDLVVITRWRLSVGRCEWQEGVSITEASLGIR